MQLCNTLCNGASLPSPAETDKQKQKIIAEWQIPENTGINLLLQPDIRRVNGLYITVLPVLLAGRSIFCRP